MRVFAVSQLGVQGVQGLVGALFVKSCTISMPYSNRTWFGQCARFSPFIDVVWSPLYYTKIAEVNFSEVR